MYAISLGKVMNLQVESLSDSSVRVSWNRLPDNSAVTVYTVYYYIRTNDVKVVTVPSSVNSVVIGDLTEPEYQFQVAATAERNREFIIGTRSAVTSFNLAFFNLRTQGTQSVTQKIYGNRYYVLMNV